MILGVNILLIAFLQRYFGALADRVNPLHQILTGACLAGISILFMPGAGGFTGLLLLNIAMGFGSGIAMPAGLTLSARIGKEIGMGSVIGITETGWSVGMIVSPIISGLIKDVFGLESLFIAGRRGWCSSGT